MKLVKRGKVYDLEKYQSSADKYNLYLSGPTSIITIDNPNFRYINEKLIEQYIKFENQDILFLYSVPVLNSGILK